MNSKSYYLIAGMLMILIFSCNKEKSTPIIYAKVNGVIYNPNTTIPMQGVEINILDLSTYSNDSGYFAIEHVPYGSYSIEAKRDGFKDFVSEIAANDSLVEFNIEMSTDVLYNKVFGIIKNQRDELMQNVNVKILNPDGTISQLSSKSGPTGYFEISNIPVGDRTIDINGESCQHLVIDTFVKNSDLEINLTLTSYGSPCNGISTVDYEGQVYHTVSIGNQCWFKENLNVGVFRKQNPWESQSDNGILEKFCFDNLEYNCDTFGGLYEWDELMNYQNLEGTQGICPVGWHIPCDEEWLILTGEVDSLYSYPDSALGFGGYDAGKRLKASYGWKNNGNGNDMFGFTALPGSGNSCQAYFEGTTGYGALFWTSTEIDQNSAWYRILSSSSDKISKSGYYKGIVKSARCIKN
ncbi:MAG: carboxypeptidase regulatory-like domain-containing protein [Bacteroidales bacterium]|nr:carboxypeptidase regulatory-like domain-containing protein [Bacteroidales bacterium]MCF8455679.1 carboxypeptidase regulatory-like domain-containing protein [Bacteroidales bacterium]